MSEQQHNWAMLDDYLLGDAFHSHDAVQCFPAIHRQTNDKYIVKTIRIPRSRVQLDALLMTGAFSSKQAANQYFKEQAREILQEAMILRHMSTVERFLDFDCFQALPGANDYGVDLYFLSPYRTTLESVMEQSSLTPRDIMRLTLDMTNALSTCIREGYLYVNLKPSNIYVTEQGYRIGDLGFVSLNSGSRIRLPDQYRSAYTPPELFVDPSALSESSQIYQLGLLLYQAYDGGNLPDKSTLTDGLYAPPKYADYEMAQIILRACAPDTSLRWSSLGRMAQALMLYFREHGTSAEPIVSTKAEDNAPDSQQEEAKLPSEEELSAIDLSEVTPETSDMLSKAEALLDHPALQAEILSQSDDPDSSLSSKQEKNIPEGNTRSRSVRRDRKNTRAGVSILKRRIVRVAIVLLAAFLLVELILGIVLLYKRNYYHEIEELSVTASGSSAVVQITTKTKEKLLSIVCSDGYGNVQRSTVENGIATFGNLQPGTRYSFEIEASGGHRIKGKTEASYTTASVLNILSFQAAPGTTDSSIVLSVTPSDGFAGTWVVTCQSQDTEAQSISFTGLSTTIHHLVAGSSYTFTLSTLDGRQIVGQTQIRYTLPTISP